MASRRYKSRGTTSQEHEIESKKVRLSNHLAKKGKPSLKYKRCTRTKLWCLQLISTPSILICSWRTHRLSSRRSPEITKPQTNSYESTNMIGHLTEQIKKRQGRGNSFGARQTWPRFNQSASHSNHIDSNAT